MSIVREFHEAFDLPRPSAPSIPDKDLLALRLRLLDEEMEEVREEMKHLAAHALKRDAGIPVPLEDTFERLRLLLKELADLRYVTEGCAVSLGLPIDAAYAEVHRSNMSKLGPDGRPIYREDGKVLKGPGYTEADMTPFIPEPIDVTHA